MERSDLRGLNCGKEKAELLHVIRALPRRDAEELREWIENYFQLEESHHPSYSKNFTLFLKPRVRSIPRSHLTCADCPANLVSTRESH